MYENSSLLIIGQEINDKKSFINLIKMCRLRKILIIWLNFDKELRDQLLIEPNDVIIETNDNDIFGKSLLRNKLNKHLITELIIPINNEFESSILNTLIESKYSITIVSDNFLQNISNASNGYIIKTNQQILDEIFIVGLDSCLIPNFIPNESINFEQIKSSIKWSSLNHNGNLIPRLIAVQVKIKENGLIPIYRHPIDKHPESYEFDEFVQKIESMLHNKFGIDFNHVLIQLYRNGYDFIGEHCDKTLDIVPNTPIINFTIGATRFLTLKHKSNDFKQYIGLEHNSLFVLGPHTNKHFLHLIKQDKRPYANKNSDELLFNEERISFTFRSIGTWINPVDSKLVGQGAPANTIDYYDDSIEMVTAFGQENRLIHFDSKTFYGKGFFSIDLEKLEK
jgi:hypothetical protein